MNPQLKQGDGRAGRDADRARGVRILAKSMFKELTAQGYDSRQIVALAAELISEVTADLSSRPQ
ncbi:MAG: hypothetical protein D6689_14210 [Deltaproteobacteria bacterium]|nr:MAG: hypothetical protein D6689_14210 [Deltaproteobacteria bacterium]